MALSDTAIVGFAETRIVLRSEVDIWELGAEILDQLLERTGFEKGEIDGLILSSSSTGAGNIFWSQTTADQLALELELLPDRRYRRQLAPRRAGPGERRDRRRPVRDGAVPLRRYGGCRE